MSKVPKQRKLTVVAAALAALCLITMTVAAKYIKSSGVLSGVFTPSPYGHPTVVENVITDPSDGFKYKTGVAVQTDDTAYAVYVRLALVISWKDDNGDVYGEQPFQDTDYTLVYNTDDWRYDSAGGYYYCTTPVESGALSPAFIDADEDQMLKQIKAGPEGYTLHVEILAQTIQAVGMTDVGTPVEPAIYDAWGVDPAVFN